MAADEYRVSTFVFQFGFGYGLTFFKCQPILTEGDYKLIDSLTTADKEKIKIDSTEGNQRAEGAQGKRPLGFILDKINSRWLDSIAKKRYKNSGVNKMFSE